MKPTRTALRPYVGTFTSPDGQTRTGVVLMRGGRWLGHQGWVGGEQVALVTWRRGFHGRQPELHRHVLRACRRPRCLTSLRDDPDLEVYAPDKRNKRNERNT